MIERLNEDWEIKPNQRFMVARALVGSVIVDTENRRGLLVLSLEVYGRDPDTENHAEQRSTVGSTHKSTSLLCQDNDSWVGTLQQSEGINISMKLIIGAHPLNALVTSSVRIDHLNDQPECGPNTLNFVVPPESSAKYKIYLDSKSWSDALKFDDSNNSNSIYNHSRLMQLRQLRTKFHELGTYYSSRASLFHGYLQQPATVFTYGKNTTATNSGALASRLLAALATSVIKDGENARLKKSTVEGVFARFTRDTKTKLIFQKILQLFVNDEDITIIGNSELNALAEELAAQLATYISTSNKKNVIPALVDHLRSY